MESFVYTAYDLAGVEKKGLKRGVSEHEVYAWLHSHNLVPVEVKVAESIIKARARNLSRKRPKYSDMAAFCWQLATMEEGGVLVTEALDTVAEDIENASFREMVIEVSDRIKRGESFSSGVSHYPHVFNKLFCSMIYAGETSGSQPLILNRLGEYFDARDKFVKKVKAAITYPVFVVVFVLIVLVVMTTVIIPKFRIIFEQIGGKLPAFTRAFIGVYDVLSNNIVYLVAALVGLITVFLFLSKNRKGHKRLSELILSIPLLGKVILQAFMATFCKTMATLLSAGVPIIESFDIISDMTNNDVIKKAVVSSKDRVIEGSSISKAMALSGVFPNMVSKMVGVGEKSGSLPRVLERAGAYYENKMDSTITTLLGLLGPIVIVVVGAIVLVVVIALYLPVFSLSDISM